MSPDLIPTEKHDFTRYLKTLKKNPGRPRRRSVKNGQPPFSSPDNEALAVESIEPETPPNFPRTLDVLEKAELPLFADKALEEKSGNVSWAAGAGPTATQTLSQRFDWPESFVHDAETMKFGPVGCGSGTGLSEGQATVSQAPRPAIAAVGVAQRLHIEFIALALAALWIEIHLEALVAWAAFCH